MTERSESVHVSILIPQRGAFSIKRYATELYEGLEQRFSVSSVPIDLSNALFFPRVYSNVKALGLRKFKIVLIPSHIYSYLLLFARYQSAIVVIHDLHNIESPARNSVKKFWDYVNIKICARKANIVYVSEYTKLRASPFLDVRHTKLTEVVVNNWLSKSLSSLNREYKQKPERGLIEKPTRENILILSIGTTAWYKNNDFLINGLKLTKFPEKKIKFIRVGALTKKDALELELIFRGHEFEHLVNITDHQLANLYTRATILVNTSLSEGFCLPILESICFGLRVLCPNIPVFQDLYGGSVDFYLKNNIWDFKKKLERSLETPSTEKTINTIHHKYTFTSSINSYSKLILSLRD